MNLAGSRWSASSISLFAFGVMLVVVGAYFMLIRPPLLPEDLRYLGTSRTALDAAFPHLTLWLNHVFLVLGGYISATGMLTMALAATAYRQQRLSAAIAAIAAGAASIGLMTAVNFAIQSDFKWVLAAISAVWACSIVLYGVETLRASSNRDSAADLPASLNNFERHYAETVTLDAKAEDVFAFADDFTKLSSHMDKSSMMMMGSSMQTSFDEGLGRAVGSHVQMSGKILGRTLFLDEVVRQREPPHRKEWETVGTPRLLVIGSYRLGFDVSTTGKRANLSVFIGYNLPATPGQRLLGNILGPVYAKWCVRQMIDGARVNFGVALEKQDTNPAPARTDDAPATTTP
jgi:hypothetical protein